jgi:predicted GNAT family acetyltransferase
MGHTMSITVQDNAAESRYELYDGQSLVGLAEYRLRPGHIAFTHTEVAPEFANRGYATGLVRAALDDARRRDLAVLPYCGFVQHFILDNPEYASLVPSARRASFSVA